MGNDSGGIFQSLYLVFTAMDSTLWQPLVTLQSKGADVLGFFVRDTMLAKILMISARSILCLLHWLIHTWHENLNWPRSGWYHFLPAEKHFFTSSNDTMSINGLNSKCWTWKILFRNVSNLLYVTILTIHSQKRRWLWSSSRKIFHCTSSSYIECVHR